jgi:prepilin-type N-terminal cleavage/methylation domain-containing protein
MMRDEHGYTLIEVLIVMVIVGILAAIAVPQFWGMTGKGKLIEAGYNEADLRAFHRSTGISYRDLLESEAVKRQYEKFLAGEASVFLESARARKREEEARAEGYALGGGFR